MEPYSVTFRSIGEAKLSRRDTPQLAAGRVHSVPNRNAHESVSSPERTQMQLLKPGTFCESV
jgi:hypothetical protein